MQTSGNGSSFSRPAAGRTTRAASVGMVIGAVVLASSAWISCSPGELDCEKVSCIQTSVTGNDGGMTNTDPPAPSACGSGIKTLTDFETKFIVPKCGTSACHAAVFPPKNLNMASMIRKQLVGVKAQTLCIDKEGGGAKADFYINKDDVDKSYILAKITSMEDMVTCPNGEKGGTRMPNSMPTIAGPRLSDDEITCFTWWVKAVAAK